jgi:glycosyltransferase involved in cell wall biosynthesis
MLQAAIQSNREVELVLAGAATAEMDAAIKDSAASGVRYLGVIPVGQVPEVISECRVGLVLLHPLPNYLESQPTKLYEYMASGRPFIGSNFGAWIEQLDAYGCGIFVDPLDTDAIGAALDALLSDEALARAMGERGRKAFGEHFQFEYEAVRLVNMTREFLAPVGDNPRRRFD